MLPIVLTNITAIGTSSPRLIVDRYLVGVIPIDKPERVISSGSRESGLKVASHT